MSFLASIPPSLYTLSLPLRLFIVFSVSRFYWVSPRSLVSFRLGFIGPLQRWVGLLVSFLLG
ncbi:hypothetical protein BJ165DRAFT_1515088 [Panaeolus papilionaceus]|nr:hypothetical protein BJ165DRAFT_1515088 [Panaeolus papilionaceus]